jgi:hypothetical protein
MARVRNNAGEPRYVPVVGRVLDSDELVEIPDEVFDRFDWSTPLWDVVEPSTTPSSIGAPPTNQPTGESHGHR